MKEEGDKMCVSNGTLHLHYFAWQEDTLQRRAITSWSTSRL